MGTIMVVKGPKDIGFEHYDEAPLKPGEIRLATMYSGISAGTQLTLYRGRNPAVDKDWNEALRIYEERNDGGGPYPAKGGWAYEEVGRVTELGPGVEAVKLGDVIYGTWGHKSSNVVTEEFALCHKMPDGLNPILGIYSQMGSIALNAILDADIHIGETVAIFGQGVPGQIAAQMARLNGARVIAVDMSDYRLAFSKKLGADETINAGTLDSAKMIKQLTGGLGADVCVEVSGSDAALHQAIRAATYNGRVVCASFTQGPASRLCLAEEFHINRIQIVSSQIYGLNPSLDHRWNRLRMEKTVFDHVQSGKLRLEPLITHVMSFDQAPEAYAMLDQGPDDCLQVVLKFDA